MATSVLTIAAATINRPAARILLDRWCLPLDRVDELEFTEIGVDMPGTFAPEAAVTLSIGGVLKFSGWIFARYLSGYTRGVPGVGYRCLGLKYGAYMIPVTATDGGDTMTFNLSRVDDGYQANLSGQSVGDILTSVFAIHSSQLTAIGITTDGTTASGLATLTVVPPDPVYIQGGRLWSQVDQLVQQWYGSKIAIVITGAGLIRVVDTTALTPETLEFGVDPIYLDGLSEDTSECYTQVVIRGRSNVDGAYLSLAEGTLIDPHDAAGTDLEATWTLADFLTPKGASSTGDVTAQSSSTLTVQSDDALETWAANYWSGIEAQVTAIDVLSTAITGFDTRRIVSNTSLSAGGTSVLTLDLPLSGSGFDRYSIRGNSTGISEAYRRLNISNTYVAQHLVPQFNFGMRWSPSVGAVTLAWYPIGVVEGVSGGVPFQFQAQFEAIAYDGTTDGYIRFYEPWVKAFNSEADLIIGGASVNQATDIKILLPFSKGTMIAQSPGSGYSGTAYDRFGVERTLYRTYSSWWDQGSEALMTTLADEILATTGDVVQEFQITYLGQYLAAFVPGAPISLNLASVLGTTSYEGTEAPVRTAIMEWPQSGASQWVCRLQATTRKQMYSGDRLYVHPSYSQGGMLMGGTFMFAGGPSGMPEGNVIEQAFTNANLDVSNEFAPVLNQQEIQAGNLAAGREAGGAFGIEANEADDRPGEALRQMQNDERRAQDQVFGRDNAM